MPDVYTVVRIGNMYQPFSVLKDCWVTEFSLLLIFQREQVFPVDAVVRIGQSEFGTPFPPFFAGKFRIIDDKKKNLYSR